MTRAVRSHGGPGGWQIASYRVTGAYPMLAIWAVTGAGTVAAVPVLDGCLGLHTAMYAAAALALLGLLTGAFIYHQFDSPQWEPIGDGELTGEDLALLARTRHGHGARARTDHTPDRPPSTAAKSLSDSKP